VKCTVRARRAERPPPTRPGQARLHAGGCAHGARRGGGDEPAPAAHASEPWARRVGGRRPPGRRARRWGRAPDRCGGGARRGRAGSLGTEASTKVSRGRGGACRQALSARVAEDGVLVMVPDPVACFAGARYEQAVRIELAASATLVSVDAFTAGRSARGERW